MKRIVFAFASTGILQFFNFVTGILIARLLGPAHRGEVSQIIAWFGFVSSIAILGLNDGVVYFKSSPDGSSKVLSSALIVSIFTIFLGVFLCLIVISLHLKYLPEPARTASWIYLSIAPLYQIQFIYSSYLQAGHNVRAWSVMRAVPSPTYAIAIIAVALIGQATVPGIITANSISMLIMVAVGVYFVFKIDGPLPPPSFALGKKIFFYGLPLTLQRLSACCKDNLDRMVLPFFISSAALGNYVVAATFSFLIYLIGFTVDLVTFPAIVRAGDTEAKIRTSERAISAVTVSVAAAALVISPFSNFLVVLLFGEPYRAAAALAPYFMIAGGLQAIRVVVGGAMKAFEWNRSLAAIEAFSSIVMFGALLIFGKDLGIYGGVVAHLLSASMSIIVAGIIAVRGLGFSLRRMLVPSWSDLMSVIRELRILYVRWQKRSN